MLKYSFLEESVQLDLFAEDKWEERYQIVQEYIDTIESNGGALVFDCEHLSMLLGFSLEFLHSVSARPTLFYRTFEVPKKSGGTRTIREPLPTLKIVQKYISDKILGDVDPHKVARAYRKNYTLRGAAVIHRGRPYMLNIDVRDFFSKITGYRVYKLFYDIGYTKQISRLLSGLCVVENGLPQGGVSSPKISNLVMREFDQEVFSFCRGIGVFYTRYADDLTFSSKENNLLHVYKYVRERLSLIGLSINAKKTNYSGLGARKYVNGIVVNSKLNIMRDERRSLRKEMYYIRKYGVNGHIRKSGIVRPNYIDHIIGRLEYAYFVSRDEKYRLDIKYLRSIKE
jgi:RNA-directed DNA polymerase